MIPLFKVHMPKGVEKAVGETLHSGYIGQGKQVDQFEARLAFFLGNPYVVALNSGTSAIHLALRLAGVGPGTEVITTAMTCTATNMPILERGAEIVWADVDPKTGNMDPNDVERKITPKTKAILCVHWGGYPCDLHSLNWVAGVHGIPLIEDAAHALGAEYQERLIGNHSRFVCFSFQAIKHLTTGDGGALVCWNNEDYERAKLLRWYGIDRKAKTKDLRCEADISEYGYKFHMNDIAATIGLEQLPHLPTILGRHMDNAKFYRNKIAESNLPGINLLNNQIDRQSAYWLFTILVNRRDEFVEWMREHGVMVSQVHARNDLHTAFSAYRRNLPGLDEFAARQVSIPVGWWVSKKDRKKIFRELVEWS